MATNHYTFDPGKLGVLTLAQWSGGLSNAWQAVTEDGLAQITGESCETNATVVANGVAGRVSGVTVLLDGNAVSNTVSGGNWSAPLTLGFGNHTLAVTGNYPAGQFAYSASSSFSVARTNSVINFFDGAGNVTNRWFAGGRTQTLAWDGLGRLVNVFEQDTPTNGFTWSAIYDSLGRRVRTTQTPVVNGVTNTALTLTIDSYYDPLVEFQELAVAVNGQRTWQVMGPDLNGRYGGMNGVGGLEATVQETGGLTTPVLNDYWGNVLATISGTTVNWNPVRVSGYGPVQGYPAPVLSQTTTLVQSLLWRTRRMDLTGYYYMGARYYDPVAAHFLSPDPLGHSASLDLYSAFNGDPLNGFDADGGCANQTQNSQGQTSTGFFVTAWQNPLSFSDYVVRMEDPSLVNQVLAAGYPEPTGGSLAELVLGLDPDHSAGCPASTIPGGAPNINGEPLWIDVDQVKANGGTILQNSDIIAALRQSGVSESQIQIYLNNQSSEGEVAIASVVPSSAVNTEGMMYLRGFGQVLAIVGAVNTGISLGDALNESIDQGTPAPLAAETARQAGGCGGAWAGAEAFSGIGAGSELRAAPAHLPQGLLVD